MRLRLLILPALLSLLLLATLGVACGGSKKNDASSKAGTFPTATLPSTLPNPIIVSGTPQAPSGQRYVVKSGDSPASIAAQFGVSLDELIALNHIVDPTALHVGDELVIPGNGATPQAQPTAAPTTKQTQATSTPATSTGGQTYTVRDGDIPETIASQFGITADNLLAANHITDPTSLQVGQVLVIPTPSQ